MNEEQLRDILPPMPLPEQPDYTLIAGGILLGFVMLAFLFWFFRIRKKKIVLPGAHEAALAELMQLRSLMTQGEAARYAGKLSDVLRSYIENRFHIPTGRQTTKEFFTTLRNKPVETLLQFKAHAESLKKCLDQCDMAKFAKCIPDQHAMQEMEGAVQQFIEATRENREKGK